MQINNERTAPRLGVLALQGAFIEHVAMLKDLGVKAREVRLPGELDGLDGLIIPGGESTAIGKLMTNWGLLEPVKTMAADPSKVVWGTCAGMILLAKDIGGLDQPLIGAMDIRVKRNAFGSQLDSFEADFDVPAFESDKAGNKPFHGVFIRAPYIEQVGAGAEELARLEGQGAAHANPHLNGNSQPIIVAAREANLLATAFHPELTADTRFHQLFLKMVDERR